MTGSLLGRLDATPPVVSDSSLHLTKDYDKRHNDRCREREDEPTNARPDGPYRADLARFDEVDAVAMNGESPSVHRSSADQAITSHTPIVDIHPVASPQHDRDVPRERPRRVRRDRNGAPGMTARHE